MSATRAALTGCTSVAYSIKVLAQIRKLRPAVQINIAEKQINTAG